MTEIRKVGRQDINYGASSSTWASAGGTSLNYVPYPFAGASGDGSAVVDVRAYGALGDGTSDDSTAIDNAMHALGEAGGGVLIIPSGTYILGTISSRAGAYGGYIVPRNNVTVMCGPNTVIKYKASENTRLATTGPRMFYTGTLLQNFKFIGGTLDGNGTNNLMTSEMTAQNHMMIASEGGGYNILIQGVTFQNNSGDGCIAFSGSSGTRGNIIVDKCRFLEVGSAVSGNYNTDHTDVYLLGTSNKVTNCYFKSSAHVVGAAFENHGIDFEACGNLVDGYNLALWITSETGNCKSTKIHDNVFYNVYSGLSFSSGNNNGFGKVDYYNNEVHLQADIGPPNQYYLLYGPDTASDLADELNVYNNRFYGNSYAVNLISGIGCKIFRFFNNYCEDFGGYGVVQSTNATFDSTYANYIVQIDGNTFRNFDLTAILDIAGGRVRWLSVQNNILVNDSSVGQYATYINTNVDAGVFTGNMIDANWSLDLAFPSANCDEMLIEHRMRNAFSRAATFGAVGSRIIDETTGFVYQKITSGVGTWRATWENSAAPGSYTWAVGDRVFDTGVAAAGTVGWVCTTAGTPGTWKTFGAVQA